MDHTSLPSCDLQGDSRSEQGDQPVPKRGRGRPAKYKPEEREQKYKEITKQWTAANMTQKCKLNEEYANRTRKSYQLLCELWNKHYLDDIQDPLCIQIKELVENKKIIA
jgi:hypothetical protein